tara:strand:+ start:517 stop:654 length:138 start_codon:yes stop_codon:yes gene_type:complete
MFGDLTDTMLVDVAQLRRQLESGAVTVDDILEEARSACIECGIEL